MARVRVRVRVDARARARHLGQMRDVRIYQEIPDRTQDAKRRTVPWGRFLLSLIKTKVPA
jgi:hypothetical protein